MKEDLFPVGRVVKLHGVRGKIKIDYFSGDADQFRLYPRIFIEEETERFHSHEVLEVTPQPPRLILKLKDIETPEEAQPLVGKGIFVQKGSLPDLPEGEYYWFEIIGMEVETGEGRRVGKILEVLSTGANDVYVVEGRRREILLPAIEGVIQSIDRGRRIMKVAWMEGLWEKEDEV
jgi:16S rRNA processing protein RimM